MSNCLKRCFLNVKFHGVVVGLLTLASVLYSLTTSIYLAVNFEDFKNVPNGLALYYRYATIDILFLIITLIVVVVYLIGIFMSNEYFIMLLIVLLMLDFMGYTATEVAISLTTDKPEELQGRVFKNVLQTVIFGYIFVIVMNLYLLLQRNRQTGQQVFLGYQRLASSTEDIQM